MIFSTLIETGDHFFMFNINLNVTYSVTYSVTFFFLTFLCLLAF